MSARTKGALQRLGLLGLARIASRLLSPGKRAAYRHQIKEYRSLRSSVKDASQYARIVASEQSPIILIEGQTEVRYALMQFPILHACRIGGYRPVVVMRHHDAVMRKTYELLGVREVCCLENEGYRIRLNEVSKIVSSMKCHTDLLSYRWNDIGVGQHTLSTLMRMRRQGTINFTGMESQKDIVNVLWSAHSAAHAAQEIVDRLRPASVLLADRGYTPSGELFDVAINHGVSVVTWNAAHRDSAVILKRYGASNRDVHPASLSTESWTRVKALPWSDNRWAKLKDEIEDCYGAGKWYAEVGTQFYTRTVQTDEIFKTLGLDPGKKTAVIFSHIFWDGTFFWGNDLFDSYEAWFIDTVKAACANNNLNWIIKVHPANKVKDTRDGINGEPLEEKAIRRTIGMLPAHVKMVSADTDISSLSVIKAMDYCVTVRGTVGIESAAYGKQVITAGTGRYDRRGFTIDSDSKDEYLERLRMLHCLPPMTSQQIELARRFAYGVFLVRPAPLTTLGFTYRKDATASLVVNHRIPTSSELQRAPDLLSIGEWLRGGQEDYLQYEYLQ